MRCPKCSYLSYEDVERCRNCGYDFALAAAAPEADLPIRMDAPGTPRAWEAAPSRASQGSDDTLASTPEGTAVDLPLFEAGEPRGRAEPPPVAIPPVLPPLVVRRKVEMSQPSAPSPRTPARQRPAPPPALDFDANVDLDDRAPSTFDTLDDPSTAHETTVEEEPRGVLGRRLAAGLMDAGVLVAIDLLVVWLTLRSLGLGLDDWRVVPLAPLLGFLFLLDMSYLVTFTAASGQSMGQMATGVRVVHDTYRRVPFGHAIVRSSALLVCALPAGLGLLPVLFGEDGRGIHDRLAGTRVVNAES